ncbi:hypothetical protein CO731_00304 [Aminobacter sp. MSH1]|uniref:hypothetical protein n=1 Tax=Aminobacter sp. MSH1 TaxID=374606 RepID=UPI000D5055AB|nr:hypothetical protein [Aminobacter sp. MSH1]AWC20863.1 hypothetical protein CO731_00304 [Aminobacter sp. MSH1]
MAESKLSTPMVGESAVCGGPLLTAFAAATIIPMHTSQSCFRLKLAFRPRQKPTFQVARPSPNNTKYVYTKKKSECTIFCNKSNNGELK